MRAALLLQSASRHSAVSLEMYISETCKLNLSLKTVVEKRYNGIEGCDSTTVSCGEKLSLREKKKQMRFGTTYNI